MLTSGAFVMYDTYPDGHTEAAGLSGTYSVFRDRIVFQGAQDRITLGWSFNGKTLRFDDDGKGGYYGAAFTPPWTKTRLGNRATTRVPPPGGLSTLN